MNKLFKNATEAIFDVENNSTIMLGGFGLCGIPENLISAFPSTFPHGSNFVNVNASTNSSSGTPYWRPIDTEIAKLWGGNLLRVLDQVQEIGEKMRKGKL